MFVVLASILGLLFGSFGTVVAHRVPRKENVTTGRSRCPECDRTITWIENIPVFSWLFLRGRCRGCGARISARYPLIELTTAVLFGLAAWKFDLTVTAFVFMGFFWTLVVLTVIDLETTTLPTRIVRPAFVVGWVGLTAAALVHDNTDRLPAAALGALMFGGFFYLLYVLVGERGMGGGDVRLAFVLGTFLGFVGAPGVVLMGMFLSFLLGGVSGVGVMLVTGGDRKMQIPFGPFLAVGSVLAVFVGQRLVDLYVDRL